MAVMTWTPCHSSVDQVRTRTNSQRFGHGPCSVSRRCFLIGSVQRVEAIGGPIAKRSQPDYSFTSGRSRAQVACRSPLM